jgi:hypothetical protein
MTPGEIIGSIVCFVAVIGLMAFGSCGSKIRYLKNN